MLHIDPQDSRLVTTDAAGTATNQFAVPNDPSLLGLWAYSQVAMPAASANAAGLAMSNAVEHQFGGL